MDFAAMPPEINSGRMYAGPGSGSLLAAGAAWDELAAELHTAAANYQSVISGLTSGSWLGVASTRMAAAAAPYVTWLSATGAQAEQTGAQAKAAAAAHAAAFSMTVPPPAIAANRAQLATLVATNFFGQNAPAIAATEALYAEMWAQDATAMYAYAAAAETASQMTPFSTPPQIANPGAAEAAQNTTAAQGLGQGAAQTAVNGVMNALPGAAQSVIPPVIGDALADLGALGFTPIGTTLTVAIIAAFIPEYLIAAADLPSPFGLSDAAPASIAAGAGMGLAPVMAAPSAGLASATSAASAAVGSAQSVSGLSVPKAWASAAPEMRLAAAEFSAANVVAGEAAASGMLGNMPLFGGAPLMTMGGRGANAQYRENKSTEEAKRKAVRGRRSTMW